jgi:hypothetical protein
LYGRRWTKVNNLYTIHPKKSDLILLYEVVDEDGKAEWGGENPEHCMQWLYLAPRVRECWYLLGIVMRRTPT